MGESGFFAKKRVLPQFCLPFCRVPDGILGAPLETAGSPASLLFFPFAKGGEDLYQLAFIFGI